MKKAEEKTKEQLIKELEEMRRRFTESEAMKAECECAKEVLQKSQAQLQDLYDKVPNAYFSVSIDGHILNCNQRAGELLGCLSKELIGRSMMELCADTPQGKEAAANIFQRFMAGEVVTDEDLQMQKADGSPVWVSLTVNVVRNAHGQIVESRSMVVDITKRKRAEDLMNTQRDFGLKLISVHGLEEMLRLCVETAISASGMDCGGIYLVDEATGGLDFAFHKGLPPAFVKSAFHYDADSPSTRVVMLGKPVYSRHYELNVPLDEVRYREGLQAVAIVPVHHEGRVIACLNVASHTMDEIPDFVRTAIETIAAHIGNAIVRTTTEQALRESEEKMLVLLNTPTDMMIMINSEGSILALNEAHANMLGKSVDELIDKCLYDFFLPDIAKSRKAKIDEVFKTGKPVRFTDSLNEKTYDVHCCPIFSNEGETTAVAVCARDITEQVSAEVSLKQNFAELQKRLDETVNALSSVVKMRDPYTSDHQRRVTQIACAIAHEMGLSKDQVAGIRVGGLIHDIGKIHVPAEILSNPGPLTEAEFNLVKSHPEIGYDIVKGIGFPWPVAKMILQHHERLDGSGYPLGLQGKKIILEARILGIADVVEAMASHRPYRPAIGIDKAIEEISRNRDILYDAEAADALLRLFKEKRLKLG